MDHPKTMKVKPWGRNQGDHVIINVDRFDPEKHTPIDGENKESDQDSRWTPEALEEAQKNLEKNQAAMRELGETGKKVAEDIQEAPQRKKKRRKKKTG